MAEENATETITQPIAVEEKIETTEDLEAKVSELEAEKNRLIEEGANYKMAYLKASKKQENFEDESEDARIRRIATEALADSRLAEIAREQDAIIKKALKENKELKLAISNKTNVAAAVGSDVQNTPVTSTQITPEQLNAFKARGWSDKDIERYKNNLRRYATT
jgi:hypothetical protein